MEKCYSIVDIEARPGGIWGLRPLDMAEVVVMVIFLKGNSMLKRLFTFWNETWCFTCKALLGVLWHHWEIGLLTHMFHIHSTLAIKRVKIPTWKYGLQADKTILCALSSCPSTAKVTSTNDSSCNSWSNTDSKLDWWLFQRKQNLWDVCVIIRPKLIDMDYGNWRTRIADVYRRMLHFNRMAPINIAPLPVT